MSAIAQQIKAWLARWYRGGNDKFTVACDYSHWRGAEYAPDGRSREKLYRVIGIKTAHRLASNWVVNNPHGQARVGAGWHYWPDEQYEKTT